MEAGESGVRQRISSANHPYNATRSVSNHDHYDLARDYPNSQYSRDLRDPREPQDKDPRGSRDPRDPRDLGEPSSASAMATATLISPNTPYYPHHPPSSYSSGPFHPGPSPSHGPSHGHGQTPPSAPGMISPVESRRTSDDHDMPSHRQSLPSIRDVIGKSAGPPFPSSAPPPPGMSQSDLPSPFSTNPPPRSFPSETSTDGQPSPRTLHHPTSASSIYGPRSDSTTFPNPLRPQLSGRSQPPGARPSPPPGLDSHQGGGLPPTALPQLHHGPPHHPQQHSQQQSQQHPPPPHPQQPPQQHQQHQRPHPEHGPPHHSPYHHPPPPPSSLRRDSRTTHDDSPPPHSTYQPHPSSQHPSYASQQQLPPPGQPHMSASYPVSPRHSGPSSLPSPFEPHQQNPMQDQPQDLNRPRTRYDSTVNRHFEAWSYAEYLARIGSNARTIYNFAEAFGSIAREEHGPQPMPGRMPGDREVCEMISNAEWLKTMLENLRGMVQQTVVNDRGPGSARQKPPSYDDMDIAMYNEPTSKPFALNEVKKRRGRAAPPGRCHSCNRIDTPEWRRGPDGARTLCNACGLHYAKLERKKQLEGRQIRSKHPDDRH